jgi:AcrR family transcriptional regulator
VLYYHFGSKEGLYLAVVRKAVSAYETALSRARTEASSAVDGIRLVCRAHVAARREWALLGEPAGADPPGVSERLDPRGHLTRVARHINALVAEGIRNGELTACDVAAATLALVGAAEAVVARWPNGRREAPLPDECLDGVLDVPLRGLAPQARS